MNDLSLHLIDLIQNSLAAGAVRIVLTVDENPARNRLSIAVEDDGSGMSAEEVTRLNDPFFTRRTTRRVGMGIPLLRQSAEQAGGSLSVTSTPETGTSVEAVFEYDHLDRPPLGDLAGSFILMVAANPTVDFVLNYRNEERAYRFDTVEIREILGELPVNDPTVVRTLTGMVRANVREISAENL